MIVNYGILPINAMLAHKISEFSAFDYSTIIEYDLLGHSKCINDMVLK